MVNHRLNFCDDGPQIYYVEVFLVWSKVVSLTPVHYVAKAICQRQIGEEKLQIQLDAMEYNCDILTFDTKVFCGEDCVRLYSRFAFALFLLSCLM